MNIRKKTIKLMLLSSALHVASVVSMDMEINNKNFNNNATNQQLESSVFNVKFKTFGINAVEKMKNAIKKQFKNCPIEIEKNLLTLFIKLKADLNAEEDVLKKPTKICQFFVYHALKRNYDDLKKAISKHCKNFEYSTALNNEEELFIKKIKALEKLEKARETVSDLSEQHLKKQDPFTATQSFREEFAGEMNGVEGALEEALKNAREKEHHGLNAYHDALLKKIEEEPFNILIPITLPNSEEPFNISMQMERLELDYNKKQQEEHEEHKDYEDDCAMDKKK